MIYLINVIIYVYWIYFTAIIGTLFFVYNSCKKSVYVKLCWMLIIIIIFLIVKMTNNCRVIKYYFLIKIIK